jgi:hypothetical protein
MSGTKAKATKAEMARRLAEIEDAVRDALVQLRGINVDRRRLETESLEKEGRYDGHYAMAHGGSAQLVRNLARVVGLDDDETKTGGGA